MLAKVRRICLIPTMDPIEITLPKKAPGVSELTGMWEDGGVYPVTITQVSSDGNSVVLRVESEDTESDMGESMPAPPKKPSMKVPYEKM